MALWHLCCQLPFFLPQDFCSVWAGLYRTKRRCKCIRFWIIHCCKAFYKLCLALLLCIGLGIGLAKRDKGIAALATVVGSLIMAGTIAALIPLFSPETKSIDTGVIGERVIGLITVKLHNKYHNIQLPQILGFFGG